MGYCSEYFVALLGQELQDGVIISDSIKYEVVVTNPDEEDSIDVTIQTVDGVVAISNIGPERVYTKTFAKEYLQTLSLNGSEIANKSLRISSDKDFLVQVFIYTSDHLEGYLAIPVNHLGQLYRVSTFCALGGYCQLAIAATHSNTTTVYLRVPPNVPPIVFCIGKKYFRSERDRYFTLNEFDVLQIETAADLTGVYIFANRPVAVFAGTRNLTLGGATRHLVEQLVPAHRWGKEYILGTLDENQYGDIVKITALAPHTRVSVRGFPDFIIENINHTVTRRIDKGTVGRIVADNPIQVIQFSGIPYATNGDIPRPGMTVVPSTHNYHKNFILSCGLESKLNADFHAVVHKTEAIDVTDGTEANSENVLYTQYEVKKFSVSGSKETFTIATNGELPFGGTLVCNKTAAMPMTFEKQEITETNEEDSECIEDQTFEFAPRMSDTVTTMDVAIQKYNFIKLRVKTCGHAVIVLYKDNSPRQAERVVLTLMTGKVLVKQCNQKCSQFKKYGGDNYNFQADWDCRQDMAFYWIQQDHQNDKTCFGYGPYPDRSCNLKIWDGHTFNSMKLSGVGSPVFYNYDLHVGLCDRYKADWRCEDNIDDCALYQDDICNDSRFGQWTMDNCRRYCGKCQSDMYGRRFLAVTAPETELCEIHVTGHSWTPNHVAVGSKQGVILGTQEGDSVVYDCADAKGHVPFLIISDHEVFVTMVFTNSDGRIGTFQVFPMDAIGKEMLGITDDEPPALPVRCFLAVPDYPAAVTVYHDGTKDLDPTSEDGTTRIVSPGKVEQINGKSSDVKGVVFQSDRPVYLFCGVADSRKGSEFYQIPSTDNLGRDYVTPSFEPIIVERPFDATLLIQADSDNTLVSIDGDFQAILPIYKRGDYGRKKIEAGSSYTITANNNINVALILEDVYDVNRKSFIILPPYTASNTLATMYIPLNTATIMSTFGPTLYQIYSVHTDKTTSVNDRESVPEGMVAHRPQGVYSERYYAVSIVFNRENEWVTFPSPRQFNRINESVICRTSSSTCNDGVDNDCDGLKDEDIGFSGYGVYGNDYDLDGDFGEDCAETDSESSGIPIPIEPQCIPINKPDDQCWMTCSCMCSWVKQLEEKLTMTEEEIKEQEEADIAKYQDALKVDTDALSSETSKKESADDVRQSAATVGYLGISMFAVVFGLLFLMDIKCLCRDVLISLRNCREGLERAWDYINGED